MQTTVLLLTSVTFSLAQWPPYGFQRPIMPQFGGFGLTLSITGGMPFPNGGSNIRFAPQTFGGGPTGGFGGQFCGSGSQFGSSGSPFGGSGSPFVGMSNNGGKPMGMGGVRGFSFPPYGQQYASSPLVLPPGALSGHGFGRGAGGQGMGSPFSSSIDNSKTSMNTLNNVPRFGGAGHGFPGFGFPGSGQGWPGSNHGFPGSNQRFPGPGFPADGGVRVIPPFLQGADKETEERFYAIVQNPSWSATEKEQRFQEFIATLDSGRQSTYEQFRREAASTQKTKRNKVRGLVEQMSPEAQQQFHKVSALMINPGLSDKERLKQISELYSKLSPQIRSEFDSKFTGL